VSILPAVLGAAQGFRPMPADARDALLTEAAEWPIIFPLAENAR
jgi:hypothetical protein